MNARIWTGLAIQVLGQVFKFLFQAGYYEGPFDPMAVLGQAITFVGLLIMVWACMSTCVEKGYSKWLGLLGLLSCVGLLVVLVLPEKS